MFSDPRSSRPDVLALITARSGAAAQAAGPPPGPGDAPGAEPQRAVRSLRDTKGDFPEDLDGARPTPSARPGRCLPRLGGGRGLRRRRFDPARRAPSRRAPARRFPAGFGVRRSDRRSARHATPRPSPPPEGVNVAAFNALARQEASAWARSPLAKAWRTGLVVLDGRQLTSGPSGGLPSTARPSWPSSTATSSSTGRRRRAPRPASSPGPTARDMKVAGAQRGAGLRRADQAAAQCPGCATTPLVVTAARPATLDVRRAGAPPACPPGRSPSRECQPRSSRRRCRRAATSRRRATARSFRGGACARSAPVRARRT